MSLTEFPRPKAEDGRWQLVACCSYAECTRGRAVPDLERLYETSTAGDREALRLVALCAMARTGARIGDMYVLDHMDSFLTSLATDLPHREVMGIGIQIAQYLVLERDPELLHSAPLYGASGGAFGIPDVVMQAEEGSGALHEQRQREPKLPVESLKEIRTRWQDAANQIRHEWSEALR